MATLNIEGHSVSVDDSFLKLSPEEQHSTVDDIAKSLGSAPAASAAPEPKSTLQQIGGMADSAVRSLANGIPFMDRIAAAGGAATGIGGKFGDYSGNLEAQRNADKDLSDRAPGVETRLGRISLDTAGHLVGGALVPMGAVAKVGSLAAEVPLGIKTLVGMGTGATIGGVQGLSGTKDLTDVPQAAKDTALGAIVGAGVGGAIPGAAKVLGSGFEKAANTFAGGRVDGMSRGAGAHLVAGVEADGPAAVQARLQELGPDAMLADAGPALLGKAQGASLNSDEGRSVLQTALTQRNEGTNARVMGDVNHALGPAEDPQTVTNAIRDHRTAVDSVNYPAALNNAPPVRIAPIMTDLIDRIDQAPVGSMEHRALTNLQDMLTRTEQRPRMDPFGRQEINPRTGQPVFDEVPVSHDDAGILHKVKGELDNVIEYDAPGLGVPAGALTRQQGALKQVRGAINDALETQVPGYRNANRVSAALAQRGEAVNLGTQYLGSGKTTASPERFAAAFDPLSQGEKIAFAKGSRGEIERNLGTKANDLQALRGQLQGEGGWNGAKIATVHGQAGADELAGTVDRNLKFRDTYNKVVENSQTAQRTAAQKQMKPDPSSETPFFGPSSTMAGMGVTAAKKGLSAVVHALTRSDPTRSYGEVARALSATGSARDARLAAVVSAINSRQGNAAAAPVAGNIAAVAAAILGNTALRGGPMRKPQ